MTPTVIDCRPDQVGNNRSRPCRRLCRDTDPWEDLVALICSVRTSCVTVREDLMPLPV